MNDRTPTEATWKTVPAENMTDQMMDAGQRYLDERISLITSKGFTLPPTFNWHEFWRAMLAASPSAPGAEVEPVAFYWQPTCGNAPHDVRWGTPDDWTRVKPLYPSPPSPPTTDAIRAQARREALEGAMAAALSRKTEWARKAAEPGRSDHDVAVFESAASAADEIHEDIQRLTDKGEAE